MALKKFKGIWPLPGGTTKYIDTLTKILERIQKYNPTYDELLVWFTSEFKLSGEKTPRSCLEYLRRFGFLKRTDNRLVLTNESLKFLESKDCRVVYDVLNGRILGLNDILDCLSQGPLAENEIHEKLVKKYNLDWKTTAQTFFRLAWLLSLGYIERKGIKYYITSDGAKTITGEKAEKPTIPIAVTVSPLPIPTPIDKYISHATALIDKYATMSEANTISTLIEPLLEVLGWNIRDPEEVQREYPIRVGEKSEYVDIALKINGKPVIFIEAKPVGTIIRDSLAEQPINYAHMERVDWCVLTNGREWRVYNAFWRIKGVEGKMFLRLSLDEFKRNVEKLQLLSKESIISGKLEDEAELEHAKKLVSEWLRQNEDTLIKEIIQLDPSLKEEYVRRILRKFSHG